jgi:hypothetical protein
MFKRSFERSLPVYALVMGDGQLGYNELNELKYLDAVCREMLRL